MKYKIAPESQPNQAERHSPPGETADIEIDRAEPSAPVSLSSEDGEIADTMETRIRELAYELYESRGRIDGHELDDWLEAESVIRRGDRRVA
jgi:hypothetical protein